LAGEVPRGSKRQARRNPSPEERRRGYMALWKGKGRRAKVSKATKGCGKSSTMPHHVPTDCASSGSERLVDSG